MSLTISVFGAKFNNLLRHYSYECKAPTQERPYTSRPSRTQQLANPKLAPKLTSDVSNELLRKKGVADEELAKKEKERGRKRRADEDDEMTGLRKRSRSGSSISVSTISTNISHSPSPGHTGHAYTGQHQMLANLNTGHKRGRSPSTSMSYTSESPREGAGNPSRGEDGIRGPREYQSERHTSRKVKSDQHRSVNRRTSQDGRSPRHSRSRSVSSDSDFSLSRRPKRSLAIEDRSKRRRHSSRSPEDRGRDRDYYGMRGSRRTKSPTESRNRSLVTRNRKSMTPVVQYDKGRRDSHHPSLNHERHYLKDGSRYGRSSRDGADDSRSGRPLESFRSEAQQRPAASKKERSLSPFSKRLALTQAMNMGK